MTAQLKKPLKLAPAPAETSTPLALGLVELFKAVKGAGFYPEGHPYRVETLRRAFDALRGSLSERELVLAVNRQGFLLDGRGVEGAMVLLLARECFIRRIASITFLRDLLLGDLELLVQLLNSDPLRAVASGGLARELEERGARTIWINEKDLDAIWAKRGIGAGIEGTGAAGEAMFPGGAGSGEGWEELAEGGLVGGELPAGAAQAAAGPLGVPELLLQMDQARGEERYQELGRALLDRLRDHPGEVPILAVLEELLRQHRDAHKSLQQREYALFTLDHLADGAADDLLDSLESRECSEKEGIHQVLAALGGKGAYWIIQRICLAQGLFERKSLATALIGVGAPAIPPLVAMLKDERWYVVRNMVSIMGELRSSECVAALKRPLYHQDLRVRKETIRALMKIGGEAAEGALIPLLEEPDEGVVRHAVLSLGLLQSRQAVPPLLNLLEKRDLLLKGLVVKKELVVALGRIGDRRATGALLKLLGTRGWPVLGRWLELKIEVAATLGDEAALPALAGLAAGRGALAEGCREALDAIERVSGGIHD